MKTYIYREGDRTVEVLAACEAIAFTRLPSTVARKFPSSGRDYWMAFTYCGTMPVGCERHDHA
jgi:hypothetical protein